MATLRAVCSVSPKAFNEILLNRFLPALLHHGRGEDVPDADLGAIWSVEVEVDRALEALVLRPVEVDVFGPFHCDENLKSLKTFLGFLELIQNHLPHGRKIMCLWMVLL